MILQGSNNPLVLQFDASVEGLPKLVVTLWSDRLSQSCRPLMKWEKADMSISGDTAVCPLSEQETASLPQATIILEAKGLDGEDNTIFWEECKIDVMRRRDKVIRLTQVDSGV